MKEYDPPLLLIAPKLKGKAFLLRATSDDKVKLLAKGEGSWEEVSFKSDDGKYNFIGTSWGEGGETPEEWMQKFVDLFTGGKEEDAADWWKHL